MPLHDIAGDHVIELTVPASLAADATAFMATREVPFRAVITGVDYVPTAAITGTDTNSRTINLKDSSGNVLASLAFTATPPVNGVANVASVMTLTATAALLSLTAGAVVAVESAKVGTGLATPIGSVIVRFAGR